MYIRFCKQLAIQDLDRLLGEIQVLSPTNIQEQHTGLTKQVHITTDSIKNGNRKSLLVDACKIIAEEAEFWRTCLIKLKIRKHLHQNGKSQFYIQ